MLVLVCGSFPWYTMHCIWDVTFKQIESNQKEEKTATLLHWSKGRGVSCSRLFCSDCKTRGMSNVLFWFDVDVGVEAGGNFITPAFVIFVSEQTSCVYNFTMGSSKPFEGVAFKSSKPL